MNRLFGVFDTSCECGDASQGGDMSYTWEPWLGGFLGCGEMLYSWEPWLGGFPGGLDSLGIIGSASDMFRDVHRGPNMLFNMFNALQGWGHVIDP